MEVDQQIKSPLKAIKAKCIDCVGSLSEVKLCVCKKCAIFPFRLGKNPFRKTREFTEDQKQQIAERMKTARQSKQTKDEK